MKRVGKCCERDNALLWCLFVGTMVIILMTGCALHPPVAFVPTPILDPPVRAEIDETGKKQDVEGVVKYIEPPITLKSREKWTAFDDGAICFRPRGWRAIRHNLTEWPKTWESQKKMIENHNKQAGAFKPIKPAWWEVWKFEW